MSYQGGDYARGYGLVQFPIPDFQGVIFPISDIFVVEFPIPEFLPIILDF